MEQRVRRCGRVTQLPCHAQGTRTTLHRSRRVADRPEHERRRRVRHDPGARAQAQPTGSLPLRVEEIDRTIEVLEALVDVPQRHEVRADAKVSLRLERRVLAVARRA